MRIRVECFGVLQEVFGGDAVELNLEEGPVVVSDVLDRLAGDVPAFARHRPYTACAVGDRMVAPGDTLTAGDDPLVLLPPVSGG